MLIIKHTVETHASPAAIWRIWEDVANWKTWDHGIEFSTSDGPFVAGTKGTLKPKGGPLVHTQLTRVEPMKLFVDESKLFLARIIVTHFLTELEGKTAVTHQIEMTGPLATLFAHLIGRNMKKNLPQEMPVLCSLNFCTLGCSESSRGCDAAKGGSIPSPIHPPLTASQPRGFDAAESVKI